MKRCMYEFLYDYVFPKWGVENVRVCMTDTDIFILEIRTEDLRKDILPDIEERPFTRVSSCARILMGQLSQK